MKAIKNKLSIENYDTEPVAEREQSKYLRQIAYWVGYFTFEFNRLENSITDLAAEHIDGSLEKNDYAYIFLTGLTFNQKVELLERYYTFHINMLNPENAESIEKKIKETIGELKSIGKTRNTIIHADYYSLDKKGNIKERTRFAGSDVEESWVSITRDFLVENINMTNELLEKVEDLDEDINDVLYNQ